MGSLPVKVDKVGDEESRLAGSCVALATGSALSQSPHLAALRGSRRPLLLVQVTPAFANRESFRDTERDGESQRGDEEACGIEVHRGPPV